MSMRDRRRRRLVETDRGLQRKTADATGGGVCIWVRTHIIATISIIGVALGGVVTGWWGGFFESILREVFPSAADAACALRETIEYQWLFASQEAPSDRFRILIATIDRDDADHTYTRAVERAFFKKDGIDRIETCRVLRLGVGREAEITAGTTARNWLEQRHADLLIGGETLKKEEAVSLWFIDKDPTHDWQLSKFLLDANLLKKDFSEAASAQLLGVALSAIRPATEENGKYLVGILKPVAERLRHLSEASSGFTEIQKANLQHALGLALWVIGEQAGDNNALADATKAFRAVLVEWTRDRAPLAWAMTQNNFGNSLFVLGERESGTSRLQEAVAAYRATLEEWTRDRVPLDWATAQNNLGTALLALGERENRASRLEEAVAAYRAALAERTRDRVPLDWATTQNNLGNALLALGERESGMSRLEEAVAAFRAALAEWTRDRIPLRWAGAQNNLGTALLWLGERENSTSRLEEAVTAYRAALAEWTRDRVPLDWAKAQNNLGLALEKLGEPENSTSRLEEAVTAYRAALAEWTRDRGPRDWARAQNNLGLALQKLGERESGTSRLEEAVVAFSAALGERAHDRAPLEWAGSTGSQGVALMLLAERLGDATRAQSAVQQIEVAFVTMRDGGNAPAAAYYEAQLLGAQALLKRLTSR
jgi:tetratricopeptide (TPR) repeat protein